MTIKKSENTVLKPDISQGNILCFEIDVNFFYSSDQKRRSGTTENLHNSRHEDISVRILSPSNFSYNCIFFSKQKDENKKKFQYQTIK